MRVILTETDWQQWGGQPRGRWAGGLWYPQECPYMQEFQDRATTEDPEYISPLIWDIERAVENLFKLPGKQKHVAALRMHYGAPGEHAEDRASGKAYRWAKKFKAGQTAYWECLEWAKRWVEEHLR